VNAISVQTKRGLQRGVRIYATRQALPVYLPTSALEKERMLSEELGNTS
jgi:hypothetical protein